MVVKRQPKSEGASECSCKLGTILTKASQAVAQGIL